ncbi:hypothetical protein L0M14_28290 [Paenibacillus hexagrammi]|uniref:Secreted protein n=1 Tax=Paenibacillus hexagrammi TaxID=2908839 RepID=A0ABY3SIL6_9BACL|nr:hypothetical protein [Paenibacillus sp. YPD9-1]UJF33365.1 hypothetical protein L0M14_28290 [Paenibacillus sp. YPD9-1]
MRHLHLFQHYRLHLLNISGAVILLAFRFYHRAVVLQLLLQYISRDSGDKLSWKKARRLGEQPVSEAGDNVFFFAHQRFISNFSNGLRTHEHFRIGNLLTSHLGSSEKVCFRGPGHNAVTLTPVPCSSFATASVRERTNALEAE